MHADHDAAMRAAADRFIAELWVIAGRDALRLPPGYLVDLITEGLVDRLCAVTAADAGAAGTPDPEAIAKQVEERYTGVMYIDLKPFAGADLATYAVAHHAWRRVRDGRRTVSTPPSRP